VSSEVRILFPAFKILKSFKLKKEELIMANSLYDKMNNSFKDIWKEIKKSKKILLTLHHSPDGDSLGSCTAMKYVLESRGIFVKLISRDNVSENLESYDFSKEVEYGVDIEKVNLEQFDYIIFLDHGTISDFSEEFREKLKKQKVIDIDHHPTNSYYGNLNYVNPNAPSCCSILYEFFEKIGIKFNKEIALRLMVGICTDTSFFIHGNSLDSLKKAIALIEKGNLDYKKDLFSKITRNTWGLKKLHGILLNNMKSEKINGKNIAYSWATKKDYQGFKLNPAEIRLGIICMQDIKNIDLIFTLTEMDDKIKGSFRSVGLDTTIYSTVFGGGGHKEASAFNLETKDMKKAINSVLKVIKEKGFVDIEKSDTKL
jgi:bifunctional oligoribonuclease and PAP phosphatase NrnA